jgi:adenylate kinase
VDQITAIFLGPQGCGKGTQASLFEAHLKEMDATRPIVHFEMGKNLREMAARENYTSSLLRDVIGRGELVPFTISSSVFSQYLIEHLQGNEHLFVDGFPRSETQVDILDSAMEFYQRKNPTFVHINISEEESISRLLQRGRADDTEQTIRKRLRWTKEEWGRIKARIEKHPTYRLIEIFGERPIEEVQADIRSQLLP